MVIRKAAMVLVGLACLAGCSGQGDGEEAEGNLTGGVTRVDLRKFSVVRAMLAQGEDARGLRAALEAGGARKIDGGTVYLAGLTDKEVEGGAFHSTAKADDAYGILCESAGCTVVAIARSKDVKKRRGFVTSVTATGKLASAIAKGLPATTAGKKGYEPLKIECTVGSAPAATDKCVIPTGFGVAFTLKQATEPSDDGEAATMTVEEATQAAKQFFPQG